jgi:hypothetical protein
MAEVEVTGEMVEAGIKASADYRYITRDGGAYVSTPGDYVTAIYRAMRALEPWPRADQIDYRKLSLLQLEILAAGGSVEDAQIRPDQLRGAAAVS